MLVCYYSDIIGCIVVHILEKNLDLMLLKCLYVLLVDDHDDYTFIFFRRKILKEAIFTCASMNTIGNIHDDLYLRFNFSVF